MEHLHPGPSESYLTIQNLGWDETDCRSRPTPCMILVGDNASRAAALAKSLREGGFAVTWVGSVGCVLAYMCAGGGCDAIVVDVETADPADHAWIERLGVNGESPPVLILKDSIDAAPTTPARAHGSVAFVDRTPRLWSLARHIQRLVVGAEAEAVRGFDADVIECGRLRLKPKVCRAYWRDCKVPLTITEFRIVLKLATQPDEDVSYRDIYDVVHGEGFIAGEGDQGYRANVRSLIKKIRKKFAAIDGNFDSIENYPGFGYRWVRREAPAVREPEPQFGHLASSGTPVKIPRVPDPETEKSSGASTMGAFRREQSADIASNGKDRARRRAGVMNDGPNGAVQGTVRDVEHDGSRDGVNGMNGHEPNGAAAPAAGGVDLQPPDRPPVRRPWGYFQTVDSGERFQVKRIIVQPGSRLSLQMHHHRAEHWIVVHGTARVFRDEETLLLRSNESLYIPSGVKHRLENPGKVPLLLIEVQWGDYLGEDDIVRFEDSYGRV